MSAIWELGLDPDSASLGEEVEWDGDLVDGDVEWDGDLGATGSL